MIWFFIQLYMYSLSNSTLMQTKYNNSSTIYENSYVYHIMHNTKTKLFTKPDLFIIRANNLLQVLLFLYNSIIIFRVQKFQRMYFIKSLIANPINVFIYDFF